MFASSTLKSSKTYLPQCFPGRIGEPDHLWIIGLAHGLGLPTGSDWSLPLLQLSGQALSLADKDFNFQGKIWGCRRAFKICFSVRELQHEAVSFWGNSCTSRHCLSTLPCLGSMLDF
jgi:hypothetical protein